MMRICIYKTDDAPELTLLSQQGSSIPVDTKPRKWKYLKVVTRGEVRADLLSETDGHGYFLARLRAQVPPIWRSARRQTARQRP
jgi:hypothetical protein